MNNQNNNEWLNDYEDFLKFEVSSVPQDVTNKVYSKIKMLLNPNASKVFFKILGFHLITGFLSLSVCHQFGMNPFNTEYSLADWFMKHGGYYGCMIGCGVSFVSLGLFTAGLFLSIEEVNALRRTQIRQNLVLGFISLVFFVVFGAELAIGMVSLWMFGSLVGGLVAIEVVALLKTDSKTV